MRAPRILEVLLAAVVVLAVPRSSTLPAGSRDARESFPATPGPTPVPTRPKARDLLGREFRALYVSSWTAGTRRLGRIVDGLAETELNALVIDLKDSTGRVAFDSDVPLVAEIGARERRIRDLEGVLAYCRERNVHAIARIAVFQDPVLARARPRLAIGDGAGRVWKDRKGLSWIDPAAREAWEYNVALAKEAAERGFPEVQFDYVRFPTDGHLQNLAYPVYRQDLSKRAVIRSFFEYVDRELKDVDVLVSADLFGLTVLAEDDLNIGQRIEDIAPYVDYICPMIYPSHFPPGHLGLANPAREPYRVVYDSCMRGLARVSGRRARLRPWLQDFQLGAPYGRREILAQIQACRDAGVDGFSMWNARNVYTLSAYRGRLPRPNPDPPLRARLLTLLQKRGDAPPVSPRSSLPRPRSGFAVGG